MLTTSTIAVLFLGPVALAAMVAVVLFVVNRQDGRQLEQRGKKAE